MPTVATDCQRVSSRGSAAWRFLDQGFRARPKRREPATWTGAGMMAAALSRRDTARFAKMLKDLFVDKLDKQLDGGDPLHDDWRSFRPLQVAREETWSDWLVWALANGTADLRRDILGPDLPGEVPEVERESVSSIDEGDRGKGNYRSDILLFWPGLNIHLEVKTGDPDLGKTWEEAKHLRGKFPGVWRHFLLMLPGQKEADFPRVAKHHSNDPLVTPLDWQEVESALRRALLRGGASASWRAVARVFAGAIGHILLHRRLIPRVEESSH